MTTQKIQSVEGLQAGSVLVDTDGKKYSVSNADGAIAWISHPGEPDKGWRMATIEDLQLLGIDNLIIE